MISSNKLVSDFDYIALYFLKYIISFTIIVYNNSGLQYPFPTMVPRVSQMTHTYCHSLQNAAQY